LIQRTSLVRLKLVKRPGMQNGQFLVQYSKLKQ
jgi:hypothetical protein